jgi:hypothetical protein
MPVALPQPIRSCIPQTETAEYFEPHAGDKHVTAIPAARAKTTNWFRRYLSRRAAASIERVELSRNFRSLAWVDGHEFSSENALVKPAITGSSNGFAIGGQLDGDAQSRRYNIPLKQCSQTADDRPGRVATVIPCRQITMMKEAVQHGGNGSLLAMPGN